MVKGTDAEWDDTQAALAAGGPKAFENLEHYVITYASGALGTLGVLRGGPCRRATAGVAALGRRRPAGLQRLLPTEPPVTPRRDACADDEDL